MTKCKEARQHLLDLMAESNDKINSTKNKINQKKNLKIRIDPFSHTNPNSAIRSPLSEYETGLNKNARHRKTNSGFSNYSSAGDSGISTTKKSTIASPIREEKRLESSNIYPMDVSCYFFLEEDLIKQEIIKVIQSNKMIIEQNVSK